MLRSMCMIVENLYGLHLYPKFWIQTPPQYEIESFDLFTCSKMDILLLSINDNFMLITAAVHNAKQIETLRETNRAFDDSCQKWALIWCKQVNCT